MKQIRFTISSIRPGDLVQLRFTGDRGVPLRQGDTWARVQPSSWMRSQGTFPTRGVRRFAVESLSEPGVIRRLPVDLSTVTAVERDGKGIAQRAQTRGGTALVYKQDDQ